jgi:hypothetical protein
LLPVGRFTHQQNTHLQFTSQYATSQEQRYYQYYYSFVPSNRTVYALPGVVFLQPDTKVRTSLNTPGRPAPVILVSRRFQGDKIISCVPGSPRRQDMVYREVEDGQHFFWKKAQVRWILHDSRRAPAGTTGCRHPYETSQVIRRTRNCRSSTIRAHEVADTIDEYSV